MDFFVYSRDAVDTAELRDDQALLEEHWSYMDRFAESMIARGPTLDIDRVTATGSLHVLALASVVAARDFIALEPNNRAGVYGEHLVWRFENLLGRSMWEFSGQAAEQRFLIIGRSHLGRPTGDVVAGRRHARQRAFRPAAAFWTTRGVACHRRGSGSHLDDSKRYLLYS